MASVDLSSDLFSTFIDALAQRIAEKLSSQAAQPARVALTDEALEPFGVSPRWVRERARVGSVVVKGPRGSRHVERADLERLLSETTIRRSAPVADEPDDTADVKALARRRSS